MEYDYKGVKVIVDDNGNFKAVLPNGKKATTSSLSAMKGKINDTAAKAFTPFRAILPGNSFNAKPVLEYDVLDLIKRHGDYVYRVRPVNEPESYGTHTNYIVLDTPENRALCEAYWNADKLYREETDRLSKTRSEANAAIPRKFPVDKA